MSKNERIQWIKAHRNRYTVVSMCRSLGVSEAGYYKHLRLSHRPHRHATLLAQIYECLREDPENVNYGVTRIWMWLKQNRNFLGGYGVIRRICLDNNLMIRRKRHPNGITKVDRKTEKSENLIQQNFSADAPNQKWLTDITEIPCRENKLYLSPILDCYDGAVLAYKMDINMRAELCVESFEMACRKEKARGMVMHSDRGSQYTSKKFRESLEKRGATQSMSGVGRCYDNARMESFFATLKKEKLYKIDTTKMSVDEVKSIIVHFVAYYNWRRIYTTNGGTPPMQLRRCNPHPAKLAA